MLIVIPSRKTSVKSKLGELIRRLALIENVDTRNCKCYFVIKQRLSTATPVSYLNRIIPMCSCLQLDIKFLDQAFTDYIYLSVETKQSQFNRNLADKLMKIKIL